MNFHAGADNFKVASGERPNSMWLFTAVAIAIAVTLTIIILAAPLFVGRPANGVDGDVSIFGP